MEKFCFKCSTLKPVSGFSRSCRTVDGFQTWCKACAARYAKALRDARLRKLWEIKLASGCVDCRDDSIPPDRLQFDHLPGTVKLFNVGQTTNGMSWPRVEREIEKCEVVCGEECHTKRTRDRGQFTGRPKASRAV